MGKVKENMGRRKGLLSNRKMQDYLILTTSSPRIIYFSYSMDNASFLPC